MNELIIMAETPDLHIQIKNKRIEKKLSQEQLAKLSNVSHSFVSFLETGRSTNMSIDNLKRISKALDFYDWDLKLQKI